jgi:hypothetical protein
MNKAGLVFLIGISGLFCGAALAADKPNFGGSWLLDKDRSFSNPAGLEQTMTITHESDVIRLEAKVKTAVQPERVITESFQIDGKESDFTPPAGPEGAKGRRKAYWIEGNRGIVIEDSITTNTPNGPMVQQTIRKWTLSRDGSTLTVDYYLNTPRGEFESKRVFIKR